MSTYVAIPVFRIGCSVGLDRGRAWSVFDELILWSIREDAKTIGELAEEGVLPHQLVVASIARLMRFRLVEVMLDGRTVAFRASTYGFNAVVGGQALPFFPKRLTRRVSFVIEWATGRFFQTKQVVLKTHEKIEDMRAGGDEVRRLTVEGGRPSLSHHANFNRLSEVAARGWDEQIAVVDSRTATIRDDEYMLVRVIDGVAQGLPDTAGHELAEMVADAARGTKGSNISVKYAGADDELAKPLSIPCPAEAVEIVVGGSAQKRCLEKLLNSAQSRCIIHSTFLDPARFEELKPLLQAACGRGVQFDLLWGADREAEARNFIAAGEIASLIRADAILRRGVKLHMRSTGSHAKILLADTQDERWVAAVGSCNWLSSPFRSVEITAVLDHQRAVAEVVAAVQGMVGSKGLVDHIANEMAILARTLRAAPTEEGPACVSIITGPTHDSLMRQASGDAHRRLVMGSNKLGSTARPGAIMPSEAAAQRIGIHPVILYSNKGGPLKNRHERDLAREAAANGVSLVKLEAIPMHGKFLAWDEDDVAITSLNWASSSTDEDFPEGDVGVHFKAPGVATKLLFDIQNIFAELATPPWQGAAASKGKIE